MVSKFKEIKTAIQKMLHKDKQAVVKPNTDDHEDDEYISMNDGEKPTVYGINRKIIYAMVGIVVVAFISSAYFSLSDNGDKNKNKKQPQQEIVDTKTTPNLKTNGLPNTYESMETQDKNKAGVNTKQVNGIVTNRQPATSSYSAAGNQVVPTIQRPNYQEVQGAYSSPYAAVYQPQQNQSIVQKTEEKVAAVKNDFAAAISFALGGSTQKSEAATPAAVNSASTSSGSGSYLAAASNALQAGTIIPAILVTGINSDMGGQVIAQVESNVYDSLTGTALLIPAGSRLTGSYSAGAATGQSRINITWHALILPDGGSYALGDSMIAIDGAGYSGLEGNVNNHTGRMLSAGAISSALGAVASIASGNTSTSTTTTYNAGQLASQGAAANLMNTASSLFQKNMNVNPTITIEPGYEFNVFVSQQIAFNAG